MICHLKVHRWAICVEREWKKAKRSLFWAVAREKKRLLLHFRIWNYFRLLRKCRNSFERNPFLPPIIDSIRIFQSRSHCNETRLFSILRLNVEFQVETSNSCSILKFPPKMRKKITNCLCILLCLMTCQSLQRTSIDKCLTILLPMRLNSQRLFIQKIICDKKLKDKSSIKECELRWMNRIWFSQQTRIRSYSIVKNVVRCVFNFFKLLPMFGKHRGIQ